MQVSLGRELIDSLNAFADVLERWTKEGRRRLERAHRLIGQRWRAEAVKRVPVDEGRLRQGVIANTFEDGDGVLVTEVGTNVKDYPVWLEFGTELIAGGRVKALGDSPFVTDAQAVHDWPAKSGEASLKTSSRIDTDGGARGRRRNVLGQFVRGAQEQMPWLRPAFNFIRLWAIEQLNEAYRPPGAKG